MKLTKQLNEYLNGFEFVTMFDIANTIQDYIEKEHKDIREIPAETYDLAWKYVKNNKLFIENDERTREPLFDFLDGYTFVDQLEIGMAINDYFNGEEGSPSYGELAYYDTIAEVYAEKRNIKFDE